MAKTVNEAFIEFNKNSVNLDSDRSKTAIGSRDWLIEQLKKLPEKIEDFPDLYEGMHLKFGSFARKTKIRPLNDIDLMITFTGNGSTYSTHEYGINYTIHVPSNATKLRNFCNDDYTLNSIKVVNKLVSSLDEIEHYKSAVKHRRQEAATLQLNSYEWNFDIVPSFYTDTGYYLIPNGNGVWKATDPRIDQNRVETLNQKYEGKLLQTIRTLKYWNDYAKMPTISSYLFENLILNFFCSKEKMDYYIDINLINFWHHLSSAIYNDIPDPKGFQKNINNLPKEVKDLISSKTIDTYNNAYQANEYEVKEENQEKSINKWRTIFGDCFPKYE